MIGKVLEDFQSLSSCKYPFTLLNGFMLKAQAIHVHCSSSCSGITVTSQGPAVQEEQGGHILSYNMQYIVLRQQQGPLVWSCTVMVFLQWVMLFGALLLREPHLAVRRRKMLSSPSHVVKKLSVLCFCQLSIFKAEQLVT